jgi:hypothetical protein
MMTRTYQLMQTAFGDATINQATAIWFCLLKRDECPSKVMSVLDVLQPAETLNQ